MPSAPGHTGCQVPRKPREETSTHHPSVCAALRSLFSPGSRRLLPRRRGQHPPLIDDRSGARDMQMALWRQQKCALAEWETQVQSWSKTRPESEQRLYSGSWILLVVLADGEKGQRCSHFRIKKPTACVLCTGQAQGPGGSSQRREQRNPGQRCLRWAQKRPTAGALAPPVHAGPSRKHWMRAKQGAEKRKALAPPPLAGLQGTSPSTSEIDNRIMVPVCCSEAYEAGGNTEDVKNMELFQDSFYVQNSL